MKRVLSFLLPYCDNEDVTEIVTEAYGCLMQFFVMCPCFPASSFPHMQPIIKSVSLALLTSQFECMEMVVLCLAHSFKQ